MRGQPRGGPQPAKVYASLKKLGVRHLQFIACLDPIEGERGAQPWALTPEAYGKFLCGLFDVYYRDWVNGDYTSVRLFDDYIHMAMGMPAGICATSGSCGAYLWWRATARCTPVTFTAWTNGRWAALESRASRSWPTAKKPACFAAGRAQTRCLRRLSLVQPVPRRLQARLGGERWQAGKLLLPCVQGIFAYAESRILEIARAEAEYYRR